MYVIVLMALTLVLVVACVQRMLAAQRVHERVLVRIDQPRRSPRRR